jgi:predicted RNase H-like HicB family nuclease
MNEIGLSGGDAHGYHLEVYQDVDGWAVEVPDLPGAVGASDSLDEAVALAVDAIEGWIEAARAQGRSIPPPRALEERR